MNKTPLLYVIISAFLFGISTPLAKVLVKDVPPVALAGLLYLGAFIGLSLYSIGIRGIMTTPDKKMAQLQRNDIPWIIGSVLAGGIIGPIFIMIGLTHVSGIAASLLLNIEGLATAMIAVFLFKENAGKNLWLALICMTIAGVFLSWDTHQGKFNITGPLLIVFGMVCWGIDNNLTRHISDKDPIQITQIKGFVAGITSISLALILGWQISINHTFVFALLLGSFSYGISIVFFIKALKGLGAARTGLFFSFAPFIGAVTSVILLKEFISWIIVPAAIFMIIGVWMIIREKHTHSHVHGKITHTHSHVHTDLHHIHEHFGVIHEPHTHEHNHTDTEHSHSHWPDTHHRHNH
jgi:drug/metabolite transporter (DMT)-like permease